MINVGVIGYGYWGPNLVRNFCQTAEARVTRVSDLRPERLKQVLERYPTIKTTTDYRELIGDPAIDAVVIATPVSTHYDLAMQALRAGKHVWLEKPLTATSVEALRLIEEAERRRMVLMVDHTFIYTGAVRKIKELIGKNELGELLYYDSVRVNLGLFQHDVNVIWDLAVHDLSIMNFLLGCSPSAVSATGIAHVAGQPENLAYLTLFFDRPLIVHLHVNWLAPVKIRRTLIGGSRKMVVYDDLEPSEKVKIYDKGITVTNQDNPESVHQLLIGYRAGDMWAPQLDMSEALLTEAVHFAACVEKGERPITDGATGLQVVGILEGAFRSMCQRGQPVELEACSNLA